MLDLNIEFKLDRIHCHDEGDGPGNAEPYLWSVFFKVDGDTTVVNTDDLSHVYLQGPPTVMTTPGNHGNLGTSDVDEGDDVGVPAIIGEYRTIMKPIPLTTPVLGKSEIGGMIGCIVVLMEEDNTSDSDAARGHERLDSTVRDKLAELLGTLSISNPEPTQEDIDRMTDQIGSAVKDAIKDGVSVIEWLLGFGNMDDQIGSAVLRFSHGEMQAAAGGAIPFSRRWKNEGDWELFGHIQATPISRPDSKCCEELKRKFKELERTLAIHEKRLVKIEADIDAQAKGFASAVTRAKATTIPIKRG
ncbi:hypothetical protein [Geothrix fermentans]|uniref:hypothetical protein n=1 Tax=Geothrix fermentans TaxID=44676 RepID=UPI0012FC3C43|nr:hypothetical protein [Geothrix fermentans]